MSKKVDERATGTYTKKRIEERDIDRQQTQARSERRSSSSKEWRVTPIKEYAEYLVESDRQGRETVIKSLRNFERFLLTTMAKDERVLGVRDAVRDDVRGWRDVVLIDHAGLQYTTVETKLSHLVGFYNKIEEEGAIAGNPARKPTEEFRDNHDIRSERPYIPLERTTAFLNWLDTPFARAQWLLAFKLGIRAGEVMNLDLRCINVDHPIYKQVLDEHEVRLHPEVRNHPDTLFVYESFPAGAVIPDSDDFAGKGEKRTDANKRVQEGGSLLPVESELKTALIEYILRRQPTAFKDVDVHPLFTAGGSTRVERITYSATRRRLWGVDSYIDSIQRYQRQVAVEECEECGGPVIEENLSEDTASDPGRRFSCQNCKETHWRPIFWAKKGDWDGDGNPDTSQKMTQHQGRSYFTNAHSPEFSRLHPGEIPKQIRTGGIRGDSLKGGDTEESSYKENKYSEFDVDIREPYLNGKHGIGVYKFGIYDDPIPAVGEGWNE
jgi:site-specific recombinase XerC